MTRLPGTGRYPLTASWARVAFLLAFVAALFAFSDCGRFWMDECHYGAWSGCHDEPNDPCESLQAVLRATVSARCMQNAPAPPLAIPAVHPLPAPPAHRERVTLQPSPPRPLLLADSAPSRAPPG